MSAWLGRPHLIDQKDLSFVFPNLRLDQSASEQNLLSPFAHMALQAQLARRIAPLMGDVQVVNDLSPEQIFSVLAEMYKFIDELPPVFKVDGTDFSLDEQHPYYVFQRHQLHVVIYMTMLDFLKPYLARDPRYPKTPRDAELRKLGVELALKLLDVARLLFDHEFPINAKFHMVVFCIFDTSTILCSAVIHDVHSVLPYRQKVMDAIESSLDMLHQLSLTTKLGASSYMFLYKLVHAAPVLSQYAPNTKRQRVPREEKSPSGSKAPLLPASDSTVSESLPVSSSLQPTDDVSFDLDQFLAQDPWGGSENTGLGGMEAIWDWDNLNLDFSLPNNDQNPL